jgi:hypothetical protein
MSNDDYAELAKMLDRAAREHRQLAATISDPVKRYQAGVNVDFFTAARNAAQERGTAGALRGSQGAGDAGLVQGAAGRAS